MSCGCLCVLNCCTVRPAKAQEQKGRAQFTLQQLRMQSQLQI